MPFFVRRCFQSNFQSAIFFDWTIYNELFCFSLILGCALGQSYVLMLALFRCWHPHPHSKSTFGHVTMHLRFQFHSSRRTIQSVRGEHFCFFFVGLTSHKQKHQRKRDLVLSNLQQIPDLTLYNEYIAMYGCTELSYKRQICERILGSIISNGAIRIKSSTIVNQSL